MGSRSARRRGTRRHLGRAVACSALLALTLTGCTDDPPDAAPGHGKALAKGDTYVAIGDSYTAAYLTGPLDPTSAGCLRSLTNYPHQVAEELGLALRDVSCGGATTDAVTGEQDPLGGGESLPPQLDAVDERTDLVTISLGANDSNLFGNVVVNCVLAAQSAPDGAPCTDVVNTTNLMRQRLDTVRDRLIDVVRAVLDKAPDARIVLVGYPQIFPREEPCEQLPLAVGDVPLAHDLMNGLTGALEGAADTTGAEYVDVTDVTDGHDICADEPWIAGATPSRTDSTPYHPFPEEQDAVAAALLAQLRGD